MGMRERTVVLLVFAGLLLAALVVPFTFLVARVVLQNLAAAQAKAVLRATPPAAVPAVAAAPAPPLAAPLAETTMPRSKSTPNAKLRDEWEAQAEELGPMARVERERIARELIDAGDFEKALECYLEMWAEPLGVTHTITGAYRVGLGLAMKRLVNRYPLAIQAIANLRDELEATVNAGEPSDETLADWLVLNSALSQDDRSLAWFDSVKEQPGAAKRFQRMWLPLEFMLLDNKRMLDYGRFVNHKAIASRLAMPLSAHMRSAQATAQKLMPQLPIDPEFDKNYQELLDQEFTRLVQVLRLANREAAVIEAAEQVASTMAEASHRVAFITKAADQNIASQELIDLLDKAIAEAAQHAAKSHPTRTKLKKLMEASPAGAHEK